jgi:hypothetical protein
MNTMNIISRFKLVTWFPNAKNRFNTMHIWVRKTLNTVFSVTEDNNKSNTFINLESKSPHPISMVSHSLAMDKDALKLQAALLSKPKIDGNSRADSVLILIAVSLCLYALVSLVTRGSV